MNTLHLYHYLGESASETGIPIYVWIVPVVIIPGLLFAYKFLNRK